MEKITYKELRNAMIHVDNSVDTERVYDIQSDITVNTTSVENYTNGVVSDKDTQMSLATFQQYANNLSIQFMSVDTEDMSAVLAAVNTFIFDVKTKVISSMPLSL